MADILKITLLIVGFLGVFVGYWLVATALFPAFVERARGHYSRPIRTTFIGLLTAGPLILIGSVLSNKVPNPAVKLVGAVLVGLPILLGLLGSAGLAQRIGIGLPSPVDDAQPWRRVLRGGIVLDLAFLLPLIGWFFLLPWTLLSGAGAGVLALMKRREVKPAHAAPLPPVVSPPVIEPPLVAK